MSYQVLARKWRPHCFDDVVGQSHVLTAISNGLAQDRLHHAYLFSGTRGVGKTTIARIFAKGLNCEQGVTATPCGQCGTCREIDEGRFVDLLEIDAASRTKVEDTRELLDNVQYKPARGRYKVYLIDEVHMLSRHSFNALLKTLEEPPEYVKFLLATTDPQKLPVTILSRCLQFHLKHLDVASIQNQLVYVLSQEAIDADERALQLIARAAQGSMRDALSLTDQAIAMGGGRVNAEQVAQMLGSLEGDHALLLMESFVVADANQLLSTIEALSSAGVEWDSLLVQLIEVLHQSAMLQVLDSAIDDSHPEKTRLLALSQALAPQDVQLFYQMALQARRDLPFAAEGRSAIEMVMLRMLAFNPVSAAPLAAQSIAVPAQQPAPASESLAKMKQQLAAHKQPSEGASLQPPVDLPPSSDYPAPQQPQQPQQPRPASSLLAARNQLRSQMGKSPAKKTEPVAPSAAGLVQPLHSESAVQATPTSSQRVPSAPKQNASAIDRLAKRHQVPAATPASVLPGNPEPQQQRIEDNAYRWQPSQQQEEVTPELSTAELKAALLHEKTPEMLLKLTEEAAAKDEWSAIASALDVARLVQQLALNAALERIDDTQVTLHLRSSQVHLNTDKARAQLQQALAKQWGETDLSVMISDHGTTPLELREIIYADKLTQARVSLQQDDNIVFIQQRFAATLDEDSVRPL